MQLRSWLVALLALVSCWAGEAHADEPVWPVRSAVDANGVDALRLSFQASTPTISIGQPGSGGMSFQASVVSVSGVSTWRDNVWGGITRTVSSTLVVAQTFTVAGQSFVYYYDSATSTWVCGECFGATLTMGTYPTLTLRDGTVAQYDASAQATGYGFGVLTSVTFPTGEVWTYHYITVTYGIRLQSVTNNFGYQIKLDYDFEPSLDAGYGAEQRGRLLYADRDELHLQQNLAITGVYVFIRR